MLCLRILMMSELILLVCSSPVRQWGSKTSLTKESLLNFLLKDPEIQQIIVEKLACQHPMHKDEHKEHEKPSGADNEPSTHHVMHHRIQGPPKLSNEGPGVPTLPVNTQPPRDSIEDEELDHLPKNIDPLKGIFEEEDEE